MYVSSSLTYEQCSMKVALFPAIFSLLSICGGLEEFSEYLDASDEIELSTQESPPMADVVKPIIVPTINPPLLNPCHNYCNYYPSYYCNVNCINYETQTTPPQIRIVLVPTTVTKKIPETTTKTVPKEKIIQNVPMEITNEISCPINFHLIKDPNNGQRCVSSDTDIVQCQSPFIWKKERCVATRTICPNEYNTEGRICTARIVCPQNYILRGSECIAPEPLCPIGWKWNGRHCEVERATCPAGYELRGDECIFETYRCPPNYKEFGQRCVKEDPVCAFGYTINVSENTCLKELRKCPRGSFEQNRGQCVAITYACPVGAQEAGDLCTITETKWKTITEM